MSYDAYDINIRHVPIWSILVSKEASGPQQSHWLIRFLQINCFENPLYFLLKYIALEAALPITSQM
jgi:hypothetical protein